MADPKLSEEGSAAIARFEKAQKDLKEFLADHEKVFQIFHKLGDEFNAAHSKAKAAIAAVEQVPGFRLGGFARNATTKTNVYDPTKLPPHVLMAPGVVKTVNVKVLEALVVDGKIDGNDLKAARTVKTNTPAVKGPPLISLKLL